MSLGQNPEGNFGEALPENPDAKGTRRRRGRPPEPGSQRDLDERLGISPKTQRNLRRRVALADRFPFTTGEDWGMHRSLEAGRKLDALPAAEHAGVAVLLDQPGLTPKEAMKIINRLLMLPPPLRRALYKMGRSPAPRLRADALIKAAEWTPAMDTWVLLVEAKRFIERARELCPESGFADRMGTLAEALAEMIGEIRVGFLNLEASRQVLQDIRDQKRRRR